MWIEMCFRNVSVSRKLWATFFRDKTRKISLAKPKAIKNQHYFHKINFIKYSLGKSNQKFYLKCGLKYC